MGIINFKKHKKQAQHIVEFALVMPIFVVLFTYAFQSMVETYAKYRLSYVFANAVRRTVDKQGIYVKCKPGADATLDNCKNAPDGIGVADANQDMTDGETLKTSLKNIFEYSSGHALIDESLSVLKSKNTYYFVGAYTVAQTMILPAYGNEYFYSIVPVTSSYIEPMYLNITQQQVDDFFWWLYTSFAEKYYTDNLPSSVDKSCLNSYYSTSPYMPPMDQRCVIYTPTTP